MERFESRAAQMIGLAALVATIRTPSEAVGEIIVALYHEVIVE